MMVDLLLGSVRIQSVIFLCFAILGHVMIGVDSHSKGAGTCFARRDILLRMSRPIRSEEICPFTIQFSAPYYSDDTITVSLKGSTDIKGFLLYGEAAPSNGSYPSPQGAQGDKAPLRGGAFQLPPFRRGRGVAQQHFLPQCRNGTHTITHTNRRMKSPSELVFKWQPPAQSFGPIAFRAAVLVTHLEWYIVKPVVLWPRDMKSSFHGIASGSASDAEAADSTGINSLPSALDNIHTASASSSSSTSAQSQSLGSDEQSSVV